MLNPYHSFFLSTSNKEVIENPPPSPSPSRGEGEGGGDTNLLIPFVLVPLGLRDTSDKIYTFGWKLSTVGFKHESHP